MRGRVALTYTPLTHKTDSQWEAAVEHREPSSGPCDDLKGWGGGGGLRREGTCIHTADSLLYSRKEHNSVEQLFC